MTLSTGARLGPYEVLSTIGAGGMGEVYKARDTRLDRSVAIKLLPARVSADPERRARFEREAKTIAGLNHPRICTLHDVGEHEGSTFLVMELLTGETLAARLEKGPLPLEQALTVAAEIADALSAAHGQGVIHRDLKPGNVMLTKSGAKLLDFGLAKLKGHGEQPVATHLTSAPTQSTPLTSEGVIVGTLHYMAPEQVEAKAADARTDLWALGAILYEMVTGKRAFEGASAASLITAIMSVEPAPVSALQPLSPPALDRLVHRCLAKAPDDRWDTAHDVADELRWIRETSGATAAVRVEPRRARGLRVALVLAGVMAGAMGGAGAMWVMRPVRARVAGPTAVARFAVQLPASEVLGVGLRPAIAFAPDGSRFAYVAVRNGTSRLFLRRLDQIEPIPLKGTEGASGPFFSPDGQSVGFFASGKLMKTSTDGAVPIVLAEAPSARGAVWTEKGSILFTAAPGTGVWQVPATGGQPSPVTRLDLTQNERTHRWPDVLPGGKAALLVVRGAQHPSFDQTQIVSLSLDAPSHRAALEQGTQPRYARTGHLVFARAGVLYAVRFDPVGLTTSGPPVAVLDGVMSDPSTGAVQYAMSDNGVLAYVPGREWGAERSLWWIDRQGRERLALDQRATYSNPRLSPDGRHLALTVEGANDNVWVGDIGSQTLARLTFETGSHVAPVWTPDGQRIAFASNASGPYNLFWKKADGSDVAERLTESEHIQFPGSWSPDGDVLAFTETDPATGSDIWALSLKERRRVRPVVQTRFNEHGPTFSPTGRWLAYCSDESGQEEIYVQPFPGPGEKRQVSVDGGREAVWSRRGDALLYRSGNKIMVAAVSTSQTFTSATPRLVAETNIASSPMGGLPSYDVSPDGERALFLRENLQSAPSIIHVVLNFFEELKTKLGAGP